MRILFFTHYFPPEGNAPASRVYELCKRWARNGNQVHVITGAPNVPNGVIYENYRNRLVQTETIDGIKTTRVWTYIAANKGTLKRVINFVSYMFSASLAGLFVIKPDIIIATSPQFFCGWAGVIVSKIRRVPFILEIRDIWPESIVAMGALTNKRVIKILEKLEKMMYASATRIVTVGNGYKKQLVGKGVENGRISVIPNGADLELFSPRSANIQLKAKYRLDHTFVCSYVGTIGMACGLEVALKAAQLLTERKHHDILFLLVGDGAVKDKLQQRAKDQHIENLLFVGRHNKRSVAEFLSISDACLVHLRRTQLFRSVLPSKMFEAAAMAKPIILGVEGDAADFVQEAQAGICIEPENANQLAETVEMLADSRHICRQLGQNGYNYVVEHFNRDDLAESYLDLIRRTQTVAEPAPAAPTLTTSTLSADDKVSGDYAPIPARGIPQSRSHSDKVPDRR